MAGPLSSREGPGSGRRDTGVTPITRRLDNGDEGALAGERYRQRQEAVVDTAARLFAERGYHATSINQLAEATGLQRGGLYHYMDGKKDLLIRIHQRFIDPLLEEAHKIVARGEPPDETLRLLARALMRDISLYHDQVTVFLNEWRIIERDPEWAAIRASRKAFEDIIAQVLERGVADGTFARHDNRIAVLGFLGMFNYSILWYRRGGRYDLQETAEQFCDIFLSGLRTE